MMRNLFQAYPVRHSSKVEILILSKAVILNLGCLLETPGELLKGKRTGLYPRVTETEILESGVQASCVLKTLLMTMTYSEDC